MAQITEVRVYDDLTGDDITDNYETVQYRIDGIDYENDLSPANASKLRDALAPFIAKGRKPSKAKSTRRPAGTSPNATDREYNRAVREWAQSQGIKIAERGRIPSAVLERYENRHTTTVKTVQAPALSAVQDSWEYAEGEGPREDTETTEQAVSPHTVVFNDGEPTDSEILEWKKERGHKNQETVTNLDRSNYKRSNRSA